MTAAGDEDCTGEDSTDAVFADQEWAGRCFVSCRFTDADLRGLRARGCRFTDCDFTRADLGASEHCATAFHTCTFQRTVLADSVLALLPTITLIPCPTNERDLGQRLPWITVCRELTVTDIPSARNVGGVEFTTQTHSDRERSCPTSAVAVLSADCGTGSTGVD